MFLHMLNHVFDTADGHRVGDFSTFGQQGLVGSFGDMDRWSGLGLHGGGGGDGLCNYFI